MNLNQLKKLMDRKKTSHKGENGHVLAIGGSEEYVGAITLAGLASLRAGCDLVTIAAPEKVAWTINSYSPDLITQKVRVAWTVKFAKEFIKTLEKFDVVVIGNGIGRRADKFCNYFIKKCPKLKVIDADALKGLGFKDFYNSIITPHEAELEAMLVSSGKHFLLEKLRQANVKEKAEILQGNLRYFLQNNNVLLLKGSTDIIISRNKIAFNRTGNQGMTKGGTGDVLAGLCAGFLAQTKDLFKSAVAAAYVNGYVSDGMMKKSGGYTFIASDIIEDYEKITGIQRAQKRRGSPKKVAAKPKQIMRVAKKKPTKKPAKKKAPAKKKKSVSKKKVSKSKVAKKKPVKRKAVKKKTLKKKPTKKSRKKKAASKSAKRKRKR